MTSRPANAFLNSLFVNSDCLPGFLQFELSIHFRFVSLCDDEVAVIIGGEATEVDADPVGGPARGSRLYTRLSRRLKPCG